jgi:hypothetical protein
MDYVYSMNKRLEVGYLGLDQIRRQLIQQDHMILFYAYDVAFTNSIIRYEERDCNSL